MADVSLYWFRDDLRLSDLPGLTAAAQAGQVITSATFAYPSASNAVVW